jgi:hypothetical protein
MLPAKQVANDRLDALGFFDPLPLPAESTKGLFADEPDDEARLERMVRSNGDFSNVESRNVRGCWAPSA